MPSKRCGRRAGRKPTHQQRPVSGQEASQAPTRCCPPTCHAEGAQAACRASPTCVLSAIETDGQAKIRLQEESGRALLDPEALVRLHRGHSLHAVQLRGGRDSVEEATWARGKGPSWGGGPSSYCTAPRGLPRASSRQPSPRWAELQLGKCPCKGPSWSGSHSLTSAAAPDSMAPAGEAWPAGAFGPRAPRTQPSPFLVAAEGGLARKRRAKLGQAGGLGLKLTTAQSTFLETICEGCLGSHQHYFPHAASGSGGFG